MTTLDLYLFRREQFPIVLVETKGREGKVFWSFDRIELPPYHPFLAEQGIDFQKVPSLLPGVVEATRKDLEEIADRRRDIENLLQREGARESAWRTADQNDLGILLELVPIIGSLYIGKDEINPYGYHADQGIAINPRSAAPSFSVPQSVTFSPELMNEYALTQEGGSLERKKRIACPYNWYRHNLDNVNAIFYKNLIIALNNEIVRHQYT